MTITLSGPPAVPSTRWNHSAGVDYSAQGIGQDMRVTLSPGNDGTAVNVYVAPGAVSAGTLPSHSSPPTGCRLVATLWSGNPSDIVHDEYTRANTRILVARIAGSAAATVAVTGEVQGYKIPNGYAAGDVTFTTSSASFSDVGSPVTVTTTDAAEVFCNVHIMYEGAASLVGEFRAVIDSQLGDASHIDGTKAMEHASLSFRSTGLAAGTHTIKVQARKVSGSGDVSITHIDIVAVAMQANTV